MVRTGGCVSAAALRLPRSPRLPYAILIIALLVVGCWPGPMVRIIDSSSRAFLERVTAASQPHIALDTTR